MDSIQISYKTNEIINNLKKSKWIPDSATGVFVIKDCILIKDFTGKSFTYRALNFTNGEQQYLFHRKNEITQERHDFISEKIKSLPFFNMKQAESGTELIDYIFRSVFPKYGYKVRVEQVNLSKHMFNVMQNGKISISDIAVGLGKTHAYLVAAIVHNMFSKKDVFKKKMPMIITTSSIELQRAIIKDYIPEISKMLFENGIISTPITCILRKGKENYLCENRLKDYFYTLDLSKKRISEYNGIKSLMENTIIDLEEVKDISNYDKRKICVKSTNCFNCKSLKFVAIKKFMVNARRSTHDFQICNHNYYLADILKRRRELVPLLPDYAITIIDEAHKLIDAARQMYGVSFKQNEFNYLIKKVAPTDIKTKPKRMAKKVCVELVSLTNQFFEELINLIPCSSFNEDTEKFHTTVTPRANVLLKRVITSSKELLKNISYLDRQLLSELKRTIEDMRSLNSDSNIYWIEKPNAKGQSIISSIPKHLSTEIKEDLWDTGKSMLLTSGTIAVHGDFKYMKNELGMNSLSKNRVHEMSKGSPFNFKENGMLYLSENMPYPNTNDDNYITKISDEVYKLIKASNGHALVLFTSYKPLRMVYKDLKERNLDMPLIEMSRGKTNGLNEFRNSKKGVLFATGSMWEGVNLPGNILSHLIIVKLPFPIPDPISEYERTLYKDTNDYMQSVLIPNMLIKLRQGVGRLIRSETDTGVISILDSRAGKSGRYHNAVIAALPTCSVTSDMRQIKQFLIKKKDEIYFE